MKKFKSIFLILAIVTTLVFCVWATVRIVKTVQFGLNCEAYLQRAANANTVDMAKEELVKAIEYIEQNNLTEGIVSIFLKNPANDMGFWYRNIKSAHDELVNLPADSSPLEKTNVLMKLRESLTSNDSNGSTNVIVPEGITVYPNNVMYFWWGMLSCIALCVFWTLFIASLDLEIKSVNTTVSVNTIKRKEE